MMFEQGKKERYEFSGDKADFTMAPFAQDELYRAGVINFSEAGICLLSPIHLCGTRNFHQRFHVLCLPNRGSNMGGEIY